MADSDFISGIVFFVLLGCVGSLALTFTRHQQTIRLQVGLLWYALSARFFFSVLLYQFGLVETLKDEDASGWVVGITLAERWQEQGVGILGIPAAVAETPILKEAHWGYYYLLGIYFFLTGTASRLQAAALNCLVGAFTVILSYRTARVLFPAPVATYAGWLTCLWPSLIVWSSQTIKEPTVIFLESVILYCCVSMMAKGSSLRHLGAAVLAAILVMPFRFYAGYMAAFTIAVTVVLTQVDWRKIRPTQARWIAVGAVIILAGAALLLVQRDARFEVYTLDYAQHFRHAVTIGQGSGVQVDYDLSTPTGLAFSLLVGSTYLLLAPFPWQLTGGSMRMLLTGPEVVAWWAVLLIGVIPGIKYALTRRLIETLPLFLFLAGLGFIYSATFGNVGLAYRQRAQLLPWLLILAAVGITRHLQRRRHGGAATW
jgi:hypothetical protein